eukprot:m.1390828 g.1390828  ORF g.1390828 m.1390828 type:complete len:71 (-) comp24989_c0_seq1:7705-7917(-)
MQSYSVVGMVSKPVVRGATMRVRMSVVGSVLPTRPFVVKEHRLELIPPSQLYWVDNGETVQLGGTNEELG